MQRGRELNVSTARTDDLFSRGRLTVKAADVWRMQKVTVLMKTSEFVPSTAAEADRRYAVTLQSIYLI